MAIPHSVPDSYLPIDRRFAIASGTALPDPASGVVVFADLSGFTALTQQLAKELGARTGADQLSTLLNRIYSDLITDVHRHHGSVISFAGDAITCWFEGQREASAVACALRMQQQMAAYSDLRSPAGQPTPVSIKVSMAAGRVRRFAAGDSDYQRLDVIGGGPLARVSVGDRLARAGEILISSEIALALGDSLQLGERRVAPDGSEFRVISGFARAVEDEPWPEPPGLGEEAKPWLLQPVFERIAVGQGAFLTELRLATTLFIGLADVDWDDAAAPRALDEQVRRLQAVVDAWGGYVLQVSTGDKGTYLYAAFGAPMAHEDDCSRAVAAALDALALDSAANSPVRCGVACGRLFTGAYGGADRFTYGVLGADVNLAARLMSSARPGEVLVSERVRAETTEDFTFDAAEVVELKGYDAATAVYRVTNRATRAAVMHAVAGTELVGREREWRELAERVSLLSSGSSPGAVIVEGEAGIGKSHLLSELVRHAREQNVTVLVGAGDSLQRAAPYHAWRAVLLSLLEEMVTPGPGASTPGELVTACLAAIDASLAPLAPLLQTILPLGLSETELTQRMSGELRAENVARLLNALLLERSRRTPLLLVFEDVHWFDSGSALLLRSLLRESPTLLLVLATRTLELPVLEEILRKEQTLSLRLERMNGDDIARMVALRLGVDALPTALRQIIQSRAQGHPFFSEEIAYALRDRGKIEVTGRRCRVVGQESALASIDLPDTVGGVVSSRIDLLDADCQLVLKIASVLGPTFAAAGVHALYPASEVHARIDGHLERLRALDIAVAGTQAGHFSFKHIITQEVAYDRLPDAQRRELHHGAARWMEDSHAADLAPYFSALAQHWARAEVADRAVDYSAKAGHQALNGSAFPEAVVQFDRALALGGGASGEQRAVWTMLLGESYRGWGRFTEARARLEEAAALFQLPLPVSNAKITSALLGEVVRQTRHRLRPTRHFASARGSERERAAALARVYNRIAELAYFANQKGTSLLATLRGLNQDERAGPSPELARGYAAVSLLSGLFGLHRLAEHYHEHARTTAERVADDQAAADVHRLDALYRLGLGDWERAERDIQHALRIHHAQGDTRHPGDCIAMRIHAAFYRARYAESLEQCEILAESVQRTGNTLQLLWALSWKGSCLLRLSRFTEANEVLREVLDMVKHHPEGQTQLNSLGFLAECELRAGNAAEARSLAEQAAAELRRAKGIPAAHPVYGGYAGTAHVLFAELAAGPQPPAAAALKRANEMIRWLRAYRRTFPIGEPVLALYEGAYAMLRGDHAKAGKRLQEGIEHAKRLDMRYEQARLHEVLATMPSASSAERTRQRRAALAIYEGRGLEREARACRTALDTSMEKVAAT